MTSLRTFQQEIDNIQHREVAKQRIHALAERDSTKENKKVHTVSPTIESKEVIPPITDVKEVDTGQGLAELDEQIQVRRSFTLKLFNSSLLVLTFQRKKLLLSATPESREKARDLLASLLTRGRGEYIFRIGAQPDHTKLFAGQSISATDVSAGIAKTTEEVNLVRAELSQVADEIGGKVISPAIRLSKNG